MNALRKIDFYGQLIIVILMIVLFPLIYVFSFLIGLFILGCWQLISALLNTKAFIHAGLKKEIGRYWMFCIADLLLIILCWPLTFIFDADDIQVLFWTATVAAFFIGIYYIRIYHRLTEHLDLKTELSGFTKSKLPL